MIKGDEKRCGVMVYKVNDIKTEDFVKNTSLEFPIVFHISA